MTITNHLTKFVDWFYIKPFHSWIPIQTFRYIVCGGINFALTMIVYAIAYNYIFAGLTPLDPAALEASMGCPVPSYFIKDGVVSLTHFAALGISLPVNCLVGFWLQKNISFKRSPLKRHVQFLRYFLTAIVALVITIVLTGVFVDLCGIWPTPAQMIIYCITAVFSFVMQKFFTFRGAAKE
jgi:putative flippase GtrA